MCAPAFMDMTPSTPPRPSARSGSNALGVSAVQRLWRRPAWLVAFALGVHLWLPGLCLAQMLSAASLGQICSSASTDGRASGGPLPDTRAGANAMDACDQCVASLTAAAPGPAPATVAQPPRGDAPSATRALLVGAARTAWRPPPRGPPRSA
jgi:hypothetical protein